MWVCGLKDLLLQSLHYQEIIYPLAGHILHLLLTDCFITDWKFWIILYTVYYYLQNHYLLISIAEVKAVVDGAQPTHKDH